MAFEHTETAWSEFLKQIQAGRPPNVKVTGQPIADDLQGTVAIGEGRHLAPPIGWNVAGFFDAQIAVAGQYSRVEMICVRPTWLTMLQADDPCILAVRDAVTLAGHALPATVFSGTAENLLTMGASALPAAIATEFVFQPTAVSLWMPSPGLPIFVERGKVLDVMTAVVNAAIDVALTWREIPQTR